MDSNRDLIARRQAVIPAGVGQFAGTTTAASATGARLTDANGKEFLDFAGGIGVMNVGHCNERVVAAIREQAGKLLHACFHVSTYEPYVALCERLVELLPHGGPTKAVLLNTGAEAVENAIKFARQATGRPAVIAFTEAFHGRTMMGMTLTSKTRYKLGCGPFAPEVYRARYPRPFHDAAGRSEEEFARDEMLALERMFMTVVAADQVAAIIIEPVLGEGGFVPAPFAYLRGLRELCDRHGIMLIFDEVQSGFCRTGRWAAYEHSGVVPDISSWAKSLGGGLPIGAVIGKAEVLDKAKPSTIGGTFGGNPVSCAAALATLDVMEDLDLCGRSEAMGRTTRARLARLAERSPLVGDVRGLGSMIGIELCHDRDPKRPAGDEVAALLGQCRERGALFLPAGSEGNVIRLLAPLVMTDAELDQGLSILEDAILAQTKTPTA